MTCPSCGRASRPGARFCGGCGKPLPPCCPACGREAEPGALFCDACGGALAARTPDEAVARKVVTIVFADLVGSTALHERLDAESARRMMDRYYRTLHVAVDAHRGVVVKLLGDGVMAAFGVPRVAEDDAIRAVRAAVGMQRAFRELASELAGAVGEIGLRVAVNTGEVVVSADHGDVVGDPVNVAARLQEAARDGDVVIGEATSRLVSELVTLAPVGVLTLKGRSESVEAYRVVSLDRPAGAAALPFVGRDEELRRLTAVFDGAITERGARLAVILGSPGLGKSRLIGELARRLGQRATVLTVHCDPAGGPTFAPLGDALRAHFGLDAAADADAQRAAVAAVAPGDESERSRIVDGVAALLTGTPARPEETFFVVRRLLAGMAATRPLVLVIDDAQWAEPLLLDLTEHLVQWTTETPVLVLVAARPELREMRSSLTVAGGLVRAVVTLGGLDAGAATRLAANVVGADELPAAVAGRVLATSEGNPLFVGELVRMLVHDGVLKRAGERWTADVDVADLEMPPTIHALLAARIERLRPEERIVLEHAAVVGRQFSRGAVAHLLPREAAGELDARLEALRRSELIEPDAGWVLGEPVLRFHHALIRDAAYRRLLKGTRAELHGRFADWLEGKVGGAVEHDETIGWHLEQAHRHLRELGLLDETGRAYGERAACHLAAAGRRALARDDLPPAASLLGRALDGLDAGDSSRAELALDWCEALLAAGDVGPATRAIEELARFTGGSERLRAWHTCFTGQRAVLTDPQALRATADAVAAAAESLAAIGDACGEAKAHSVHALALGRLGKVGASEAVLDRALAAARRARDRRRANSVLAGAPVAALWGPSPVRRASGRCLDVVRVLRITQGAPAVEAVALRCQAVLESLRGRTEAARRMIASARHMVEELGITHRLLEADMAAGLIDLIEGDAVAAERVLRGAYDGLRAHGLGIDAAQAAALLGRALLALDRAAEAEVLSEESETLAGDDLQAGIAWRGVRAEALARRGEHVAAVEFARAAVAIAAATDALLHHADARSALATALDAAGRPDEAAAEESKAIELWEAKGATRLAARSRRVGGRLGEPDRMHDEAGESPRHGRRRPRENAATAHAARLDAAIRARNVDALADLIADGCEVVHHPTVAAVGRESVLSAFRVLLQAEHPAHRLEPLATLGDSLALFRRSVPCKALVEDDEAPFGAVDIDDVVLIDVDAEGRQRRGEVFAADRLDTAVARSYERYAELLSSGPERTRAWATARAVAAMLGPMDVEAYGPACAASLEFVDHRTVGVGTRGIDAFLGAIRVLLDLVGDIGMRLDDVGALDPEAFLVRWTTSGRDRAGGGPVEWDVLRLCVFGPEGLVTRYELFTPDQEQAALARFDGLVAERPVARFGNAATRAQARLEQCWGERDWDGVVAAFAAGTRMEDRRALVGMSLEGKAFVANMRMLFDTPSSRWESEPLATRGERLALFRVRVTGEIGAGGDVTDEHLAVVEYGSDDRVVALVVFDLDAVDAAYAELDDRYGAGEGAPLGRGTVTRAFRRAFAARDWDAFTSLLAPDLVVTDHRLLGWETLRGPAAYVQALRSLVDLAPDVRLRLDHVIATSEHGVLYAPTWLGSREGGAFEAPSVIVAELDGLDRFRRFDQYDLTQLDAARAHFDVLEAGTHRDPLDGLVKPNAATRARDRWHEHGARGDWDALRALCAPVVWDDRRRFGQTTGDCEMAVTNTRLLTGWGTRVARTLLATAGDRVALEQVRYTGGGPAAPFEIESLEIVEVDGAGRIVAIIVFDPDARRAAFDEIHARFVAGEAAGLAALAHILSFVDAVVRQDWDAARERLARDLVFHDHRPLGLGTVPRDAWIDSLRIQAELAPDVDVETPAILAWNRHGRVDVTRVFGPMRDGGPFENVFVRVLVVAGDRIGDYEVFDVGDAERALARFAALCDGPARAAVAGGR